MIEEPTRRLPLPVERPRVPSTGSSPSSDDNPTEVRRHKSRYPEAQQAGRESGNTNELPPRSSSDPSADSKAADVLSEELLQRLLHEEKSRSQESPLRFSAPEPSLPGLDAHNALRNTISVSRADSWATLRLPDVGDQLFGFLLLQELGHGAFARVFLAKQGDLADRPVVLKISAIAGTEPQTLAQLQHTHIVPIYSVHDDPHTGVRAVCMPYFGGASLSQILSDLWSDKSVPVRGEQFVESLAQTEAPLPLGRQPGGIDTSPSLEPEPTNPGVRQTARDLLGTTSYVRAVAWILSRLALGLQHAHQRGVLHRDIKPSNILISADGEPLLLDFNVSQEMDCDPSEASMGGTIAYMSPEHLQAVLTRTLAASRQVDRRSDIYGLGMVLFEMLAGQMPFDQTASYSAPKLRVEAMALERGNSTPSLRALRPNLPWSLESILQKCLAPDPTQRYQQAEHLAEDLQRFLDDRSLRYAPELSRLEQVQKWRRRHPRLVTVLAVVLGASLLLTGAGIALALVGAHLSDTREELTVARAHEQRQTFESNTMRALCLVNTIQPEADHLRLGTAVCEEALAAYGVLDNSDWQGHPLLLRLSADERRHIDEDVRELLLLLAGARVRLEPGNRETLRQALDLLERAEAITSLSPSRALWQDRSHYLDELGEKEQAALARRRADEVPAASARDHYLLATAFARRGTRAGYTAAVAELDAALELDPRHYWSWLQRGLCHQELGESVLAAGDFGSCIGLWPDFAWGYFNRGYVFGQNGKLAEAISEYTAALKHDPTFRAAYVNRGLARLELKKYAEALADLEKAQSLGRSDAATEAGRGMALEGVGRHEEADAAFQEALGRLSELPVAARARIQVSYGFAIATRLPETARAAFDAVLEQNPEHLQALYGRAMIAAGGGNVAEAIDYFDRALLVNPEFLDARRYRAVMLARNGSLSRATQEINACLQKDPNGGATLYTAACVAALAAEKLSDPRLGDQAVDLLRRAGANGVALGAAKGDPDLTALREHPEFKKLLQAGEGALGGKR